MSVINMVENIKKVHPSVIIFYEIGTFYYTYGKDAYIISYMFDYKLRKVNNSNIESSAFPKKYISKIKTKIEKNKIDYILIDVRNNYEVCEKDENGNLNNYDKIYEKAHYYVKCKKRIQLIGEKLLTKIEEINFKEKIKRIENIINEN